MLKNSTIVFFFSIIQNILVLVHPVNCAARTQHESYTWHILGTYFSTYLAQLGTSQLIQFYAHLEPCCLILNLQIFTFNICSIKYLNTFQDLERKYRLTKEIKPNNSKCIDSIKMLFLLICSERYEILLINRNFLCQNNLYLQTKNGILIVSAIYTVAQHSS